jgi:hypothetical protein
MSRRLLVLLTLFSSTLFAPLLTPVVSADQLLGRSLKLGDSQANVSTNYEFGFDVNETTPIAAITFQFCSNTPFPDDECTVPDGLDVSNAVLVNQSGNTGFAVAPQTTANRLVLERNGAPATTGFSSYRLAGVLNPVSDGSYYVRIQTYQTTQTTGEADNYGGIAFVINRNVEITATVPPYLLFCVGVTVNGFNCENVVGNYVNFGELSSRQATQGTTQMLAATNATDGYTIRVNGPTLTSGTNVIPGLVGSDISRPGVSQFGMNLRANNSPQGGLDVTGSGGGLPTNGYNQINNYRFNSGDVVAVSNTPDRARKYTSTYLVNITRTQAPGAYVSTLTYVALGSF